MAPRAYPTRDHAPSLRRLDGPAAMWLRCPPCARGRLGRGRTTAQNPPDRVATQRHPPAGRHPCPRFAASFTPKDAHGLGQPPRPWRMPGGKRREAFRKGPAGTRGRETTEPPDGQAEAHRVLCDREIPQAAGVGSGYALGLTACDNPGTRPRVHWRGRRSGASAGRWRHVPPQS